ncbi:MAG: hypothetical protein ABR936_10235 [Bacteroidota bacterium]|jgi:hypothetical protein
MKLNIRFAILLSLLLFHIGCKKDESNPIAPTVVATEEWEFIINNDSSNHGQITFEKTSDGHVSENAIWYFVYQDSTVQCPFKGGNVTITDTTISIIAQGTATYPAAPVGYQTSAFNVNLSGSAHNGISYGTWGITFSTFGWPSQIAGTFTATRKSGSGITK